MFSPITLRDSYTQEMVENHIQRSKTGETQSETYVKGEQRISGDYKRYSKGARKRDV
jgi:hypothetical protein